MSRKNNFSDDALQQLREPPCMERTIAKLAIAWPKMDDYRRGQLDMLLQIAVNGGSLCQR